MKAIVKTTWVCVVVATVVLGPGSFAGCDDDDVEVLKSEDAGATSGARADAQAHSSSSTLRPAGSGDASSASTTHVPGPPIDAAIPDAAIPPVTDAAIGQPASPDDAPPAPFGPGNGMGCTAAVGSAPDGTCDPSDEQAAGCLPYTPGGSASACVYSPKCGNLATCEPFVTNPLLGTGVDNFRMRLVQLTAPPSLTSPAIQAPVITNAVDLPSSESVGGAPCGENGTGLFNWLLSVDKAHSTLTTGGAPVSSDPFGLGYCYLRGTVQGHAIAPVTTPVTFTGDTFSSQPFAGTLSLPIFLPGSSATVLNGVVILPISALALSNVTISEGGDCIGSVNNSASTPSSSGVCTDPAPSGFSSCSRWHSAGAFSGYITLANADDVVITTLSNESLCVLLTGDSNMAEGAAKCTAKGLSAGDYCSGQNGTLGQACSKGDSVWISGEFAASAVNVTLGAGVTLCNGGSIGG